MKLYNGSCVYLTARTRPAVHHDDVAVDDSDTCVRVGAVMIDGVFLFVSTQPQPRLVANLHCVCFITSALSRTEKQVVTSHNERVITVCSVSV